MSYLGGARYFGLIVAICGVSLLAERLGVFAPWNQRLGDMRMVLSPKVSEGQFVFVAVDAQSLTEVGTWPWSRGVHAALLDAILEAGAVDVLFDFDFTFPADPEGDRAFQAALRRAGGMTYLAAFQQSTEVGAPSATHVNLPLPAFAAESWPALVNVSTDAQGLARDYPFGTDLAGEPVFSAGALMANRLESLGAAFEIDFSLRPDTVPTVSAIDVVRGAVPDTFFAGRSVIIGASAIELSDRLAVPVHGIVPGPMIHILAAETLARDLAPLWLRAEWMALGMGLLLGLLHFAFHRSAWLGLGGAALGLAAVEAASLIAFRTASLQVPGAMLYPGVLAFGLWHITRALSKSNWLLLKASIQARNTLRILEHVFDDASDGIVILKSDGSILRHSASATSMFGRDDDGRLKLPAGLARAASLQNVPPNSAVQPPRTIEFSRCGSTATLEYQITRSEVELPRGRGLETASEQITTLVFRDVTRLKEQEQDIAYLSNYDERTGALRRGAILAFLGLRLEERRPTAVFAFGLNRFKTINVTLGRDVGDALLKEVVTRLERSPFPLSPVARLGGTSFAVYTEGEVELSEVCHLAEGILDEIARPYRLDDVNAQIGARIGYSLIGGDSSTTAEDALEQAEEALDSIKLSRSHIAAYDRSAWEKLRRAREVERAMEDALAQDEFELLYQPQHRVSDGVLVGAEALIRWHSPKLGQVMPDEFIGIAESTGFIVELGRWTLERAAKDTLTLPPDLTIAVNVSGLQIMRRDFAQDVAQILQRVGLPPHRICLELTETVLLSSTDGIVENMQDLGFLGVTWALDDFGTGFSSMEYLSKMPLDKIKLDKSFTLQLGKDASARPILHSTSELCRGLGVKLLCEGVETEDQLRVLAIEGCAEAQGFLFGKPMSLDAFRPKPKVPAKRP